MSRMFKHVRTTKVETVKTPPTTPVVKRTRKYGKLPAKEGVNKLHFGKYAAALPAPPSGYGWGKAITQPWGMMLNDTIGDCTCAGVGHAIQVYTSNHHKEVTVSDADVLNLYITITGLEGAAYNPTTGENDNGCVETDVLNYWQDNGFAGHKLGAWAAINQTSKMEVMQAIYYFGGIYIGLELPLSMENQTVWSIPNQKVVTTDPNYAPGSAGGHCVYVVSYDQKHLTCVTWGMTLEMTWDFFFAYCSEAYALISADWVNDTTKAPNGFDMNTLLTDLATLQR